MAHKKSSLTLSQACEGMIHYKTAAGKSPHTISDYRNSFKKLKEYFAKNPRLADITRADLFELYNERSCRNITPGPVMA